MRKTLLTVLFLVTGILVMKAQEIKISGTVQDETGEGLPGVTVQVKGTTTGTITDFNGSYTITAESEDILVYSFIGYQAQEIQVGTKSQINVTLEPDLKELEEVVVVGYGTMKKSDLTGAVTSIDSDDIAKTRSANVVEVLQGKAPGMDISRSSGRAGSGYNIQIRGTRSITASNDPLYIVDGVPYGSQINIDPNDIESIEVLKDASSTAIYGSRGANGVVIVTTKKGAKGTGRISFNMYAGVTKRVGDVPLGDRDFFLGLYNDLQWMIDRGRNPGAPRRDDGYNQHLREFEDPNADVDWYDVVLQDGSQQNYNLSFSGSSERLSYSTSLSYYDEVGMIPNDRFQRGTLRLNLEGKINDNISVGTSSVINFNRNENRTSPLGDARKLSPLAEPYDTAGNLIVYPRWKEEVVNPLLTENRDYYFREGRDSRTFSTFYVNLSFLNNDLNFRSSINFDLFGDRDGEYRGVWPGENGVSQSRVSVRNSTGYTFQNVLNYNKAIGSDHSLKFTLGSEAIYNRTERYRIAVTNLSQPTSQWYNLASYQGDIDIAPGGFPLTESTLLSYFTRLHYGFLDRYIFQVTGRYDGSSKLAEGNKWAFFPSASFAWRIAEEPFFPQQNVLTDLKFRASWGVSGNQAVDAFDSRGKIRPDPLYYEFGISNQAINSYRTLANENRDLSWESTAAYNIGLDFEFLDGRISGSAEYYTTETSDLLLGQRLSPHAGITEIIANVGSTKNNGVELSLNAAVIETSDFSWNTTITFYSNKEEITSLNAGVERDIANGWFVGQPVDVYYDFDFQGIWQILESDEAAEYGYEPGEIKFRDINGDTAITGDDRTIIGTSRPDWVGGWTNSFTYKNFDLSIIAFTRQGHMIRDRVRSYFAPNGLNNSMKLDYWVPTDDGISSNTTPRLDPQRTLSGYGELKALEYTDGSFIKIRDITLGYSLPSNALDYVGIDGSARVYITVKNALILSKYGNYTLFESGVKDGKYEYRRNRNDPELRGSIDLPMPRLFAAGISLTF